jgi:hypothetical protein
MHLPKIILTSVCGAVIAAAVLSAGCKLETDRVVYRSGNAFFPLLDSRVLRYEEQRGDKTREYTLTMKYAGGQSTKVYPLHIKGVNWGDCALLSRDSTVVFSTSDPYTTMEPREMLPEYRQVWVDASTKPGENWIDDDTGTKTTFIGFEKIEVPAGTFDNSYRTLTEARPELFDTLAAWQQRGELKKDDYNREVERAHQVIMRWFAPGVGLVKEQIGSEITRVLLKIEQEGAGVADTTKPEKYDIQG